MKKETHGLYLVTGGAGFSGSRLVMHWRLAALEVVGMMKGAGIPHVAQRD